MDFVRRSLSLTLRTQILRNNLHHAAFRTSAPSQYILNQRNTTASLSASIHNAQQKRHMAAVNQKGQPIAEILEREIQEESAELNRNLTSDQFPGFSVETDGADVKLTKSVRDASVSVQFTVSSSLTDWPTGPMDEKPDENQQVEIGTTLLSMPDFQVQISRKNQTLEMSCYFEEMDADEETGEPYPIDPTFGIDELVLYDGEPKETEFAVSAEYFHEDLQSSLLEYLSDYGIDDEFAKKLVEFATNYEKKQYVSMMKRLKNFVSS